MEYRGKDWKDCYFETGVFFVFFFSLLIKRYLIRSWIVLYKKRNILSRQSRTLVLVLLFYLRKKTRYFSHDGIYIGKYRFRFFVTFDSFFFFFCESIRIPILLNFIHFGFNNFFKFSILSREGEGKKRETGYL